MRMKIMLRMITEMRMEQEMKEKFRIMSLPPMEGTMIILMAMMKTTIRMRKSPATILMKKLKEQRRPQREGSQLLKTNLKPDQDISEGEEAKTIMMEGKGADITRQIDIIKGKMKTKRVEITILFIEVEIEEAIIDTKEAETIMDLREEDQVTTMEAIVTIMKVEVVTTRATTKNPTLGAQTIIIMSNRNKIQTKSQFKRWTRMGTLLSSREERNLSQLIQTKRDPGLPKEP